MKKILFYTLLAAAAFCVSCTKEAGNDEPASDSTPELIRVTPDNGGVDEIVKIIGKNFSMKNKENVVLFGDKQATIDFSYTDTLLVYVPSKAGSTISVTVKGVAAKNTLPFTYNKSIAVTTVAGCVEGGTQTETTSNADAKFLDITGFCFDDAGDIYVTESGTSIIKKVSLSSGQTSLFAGAAQPEDKRWAGAVESPVDGDLTTATFLNPKSIAYVGNNTFYVADQMHNALRKIQNGKVTTVGGCRDEAKDEWNSEGRTVVLGTTPETCKCKLSEFVFARPTGLAYDKAHNHLYLSSLNSHYVVRIDLTAETVELVAGKPWNPGIVEGEFGTGRLNTPTGIAVDADQNLYIVCDYAHCVVKVDKNKNHKLIAGWPDQPGYCEGYPSISAQEGQPYSQLNRPQGIASGPDGKVYVCDYNHVISVIDPATCEMKSYCGEAGYNDTVDGGLSTAKFYYPSSLQFDAAGCLWVSQSEGAMDGLRKFDEE